MFNNEMTLSFRALSQNEAFARVAVSAFCAQLNPTLNDISDIKTAVSEAVTNAIIHGYANNPDNYVNVKCALGADVYIEVNDNGMGIEDVAKAREPLYTSKPELERSGMGFTVMETFMDTLKVISQPGMGTTVIMTKNLGKD